METTVHHLLATYVQCAMPKLTKQTLSTRFPPIFWKTPFSCIRPTLPPPPFLRIRARLEKKPLYVCVFVHTCVPKSNSI